MWVISAGQLTQHQLQFINLRLGVFKKVIAHQSVPNHKLIPTLNKLYTSKKQNISWQLQ